MASRIRTTTASEAYSVPTKNYTDQMATLAERFWAKVDRRGPDKCWPWLGARGTRGYGTFESKEIGQTHRAHRIAWLLTYQGPIMPRDEFRHSCDNTSCVNPGHLTPGSHAQNMRDMVMRRRIPSGVDHFKAKLNESDIYEIRELAKAGVTHTELAYWYKTTTSNISYIKRRMIWKYIE